MNNDRDVWALAEACLRLAWYSERFGQIPEEQQRRLMKAAMGQMFRRTLNEQDQKLVNLSKELMKCLRQAHQDSDS